MPSNLSEFELTNLIEDLLRLKNCMHDLRAEVFAQVADKAVKAIDELRQIIRERRDCQ